MAMFYGGFYIERIFKETLRLSELDNFKVFIQRDQSCSLLFLSFIMSKPALIWCLSSCLLLKTGIYLVCMVLGAFLGFGPKAAALTLKGAPLPLFEPQSWVSKMAVRSNGFRD